MKAKRFTKAPKTYPVRFHGEIRHVTVPGRDDEPAFPFAIHLDTTPAGDPELTVDDTRPARSRSQRDRAVFMYELAAALERQIIAVDEDLPVALTLEPSRIVVETDTDADREIVWDLVATTLADLGFH
jgi:hypothetical protein